MKTGATSWVSGAVLAGLTGGAAWWWLGAAPAPETDLAPVAAPSPASPVRATVASAPPPPEPGIDAQRFKVVGTMRGATSGTAEIEVDGQNARTFRVGDTLTGNLVVREATAQGVVIGPADGGPAIKLQSAPTAWHVDSRVHRDLSDGSAGSAAVLRERGAKNAPMNPPSAAEQASAAQASVPTDPGGWRPPP